MLSNQDIWNAENNNNDDSKLFYQKIEEFQKGNYPKKPKISYFEDYNDDVDESVVLVKIDQIHQIANNEFKQNNLKEINASKSGNEKAEGFVSPSHNTCSTLTSPVSDETTNALLCSIDKAKYFTPKCLKVSGNNEIMSLNCIKKELNFNSITNGNANSSGNGNGTTNNGVIANRTTSPSPWQNSKKTFVVPSSKFDLPFGNTHLVIGNNNTNQGYSNYTNGKSYSFIGKPKGKDSNNINPIGTASFPTGTQPEVTSKKINLENIIIGSDKRTTLMLRNIPNKYTLSNILEEISHSFWAKYDYINLPIDYERKLNLGYAFINFSDPLHIVLFYETYRFKKWSKYKSDKKMDMNYADKQGKKDVNSKDTQSYFLEEDKRFNHVVLQPKIEIPVVSNIMLI